MFAMARFCTSRAPPAGATRGLIRPFNACSQLAGRAGDRVATMREARKPFGGATDGAPQPAAENAVVGTLNENRSSVDTRWAGGNATR